MDSLIECVPNFSEGRNPDTIDKIANAIASVDSSRVLDIHSDADHNRTVITFVCSPANVGDAAFLATQAAAAEIDLNHHTGEHPRVGATDVIPLIPVVGVTKKDCIEVARALASRISDELGIPTYLYGEAALVERNRTLSDIRRGGFEKLRQAIRGSDRRPDFGPCKLHPTAGATAVGVRSYLVAYNVLLDTRDVSEARAIAVQIRESEGGVKGVQAMGFNVRGKAQVSTNLTDVGAVNIQLVYREIAKLAASTGTSILGSEIVGLAPRVALEGLDAQDIGLPGQIPDYVLEDRISS